MASARDLIVQRIRERGPLTVAEFMSIALYHPEHGYYARAARRTGRNGDFFTSVDVGPASGATLPDSVRGVIYANELLDALPVHSVVMTEHGLREHYVDLDGDRLIERAGRPSTDALEEYLRSANVDLQPGWRSEINLAALVWMARACCALHRGFLLLVDYGHPAAE